ncbi:MAG: ABC transporter ATP-binding protein [Thermoflexibacter sp.]|nr:ABC transporter ATP-binding protein [Thermoflexibacter sp.]
MFKINQSNNHTTHRVLTIEDLTISYQLKHNVLENLNLNITEGQVHGLVGINGAGKTTLLKCISGEIKSFHGKIQWQGQPISTQYVSLLETNNYFYHYLTGKEYLQIFQYYHKNFDLEVMNDIFQLPLQDLIDNYSTGMKKKLAFMAILSLDRPFIILDEPFNGIDIEGSFAFRKIIQLLKEKGKTLLITSHIIESLTSICDQIHYLTDKKISKTYLQPEFGDLQENLEHLLAHHHGHSWEKIKNII